MICQVPTKQGRDLIQFTFSQSVSSLVAYCSKLKIFKKNVFNCKDVVVIQAAGFIVKKSN